MYQTIDGLILADTSLRESDKFLSVLTADRGRISLYGNHVRNIKRGAIPYTTPMQYCRFQVEVRGGRTTLRSGDVIHSFLDITKDLCGFSLAQYVMDVVREVTVEGGDEADILQLTLNTLHMIQAGKRSLTHIKATFEMRIMMLAGYMPDLGGCDICGREQGRMYFDIMNGILICPDCHELRDRGDTDNVDMGTARIIALLSTSVLQGLRYVLSAPANRIFAYSIAEDEQQEYADVCEKYILNHLERGFDTLDFYKDVISM